MATIHTDILLDDNLDIRIEHGDLVVGDSSSQEAKLLLISNPGSWRMSPLVGVGLIKYINAPLSADTASRLNRDIHLQYQSDDKTVNTLEFVTDDYNNLLDVQIDFSQQ